MKGISKKLCLLLEARGAFLTKKQYELARRRPSPADDCWLKICIAECPLEDECIYDYSGKIREADRKLLEEAI